MAGDRRPHAGGASAVLARRLPDRLHELAQPGSGDPSGAGGRRSGPAAELLGIDRHPRLRLDPAGQGRLGADPRRLLARPALLVLLLGLQRPHRRLPRRQTPPGAPSPTSRSPTSTASGAACCSPGSRRTNRPPGSGTGAAPWGGCGCTASGCWRICPDISTARCSWPGASRSSPTTRASAIFTRRSPTAPICAGTPTTTRSTPATRRPTGSAWSTSARVICGWWTRWRRTRCRANCRYGSVGRAPAGARTRSRPPTTSTRSRWTPRAGRAPSPYAAACTG